jgi:hypothetical protein
MIESRIPPHAPGKLTARIKTQGQRGDRRTEDIADDRHQAVGEHHRPETRPHEDDNGADAQKRQCQGDRGTLAAGLVDRRADRRLDCEPQQPADRRHHADFGLAPLLLSDQEYVEVRSEPAADIGEQEIDGIERERAERLTGIFRGGSFRRQIGSNRRSAHPTSASVGLA